MYGDDETATRRDDSTSRSVSADVEEWAERERRRRQSWLQGPTEQEKIDWAGAHATEGPDGRMVGPTNEEVQQWAERERRRRQAWLEGPTEAEKLEWSRRQQRRRPRSVDDYDDPSGPGCDDEDVHRRAAQMMRETELATKGAVVSLVESPFLFWSRLIRAGRQWEEVSYRPRRRRHVALYED